MPFKFKDLTTNEGSCLLLVIALGLFVTFTVGKCVLNEVTKEEVPDYLCGKWEFVEGPQSSTADVKKIIISADYIYRDGTKKKIVGYEGEINEHTLYTSIYTEGDYSIMKRFSIEYHSDPEYIEVSFIEDRVVIGESVYYGDTIDYNSHYLGRFEKVR